MRFLSCFFLTVAAGLLSVARLQADDPLETIFAEPPASAHPHTWWHWVSGNVREEGITLDLEAMKRIGVTGVQIFNVDQSAVVGPVLTGSPEWRALTKRALEEADRLGIEVTVHNCAGWSESGGPWVTPEQSMQKVVWTETRAHGDTRFTGTVAQPETVQGFYRDIALLAFPTCPRDTSLNGISKTYTMGGKHGTPTPVSPSEQNPATQVFAGPGEMRFVQAELAVPAKVTSVLVKGGADSAAVNATIEASQDGKAFRRLTGISFSKNSNTTFVTFRETTARYFRVAAVLSRGSGNLTVSGIEFYGPRIPGAEAKAGFRPDPQLRFSKAPLPSDACIDRNAMIDLTARLRPEGKLDWNVPPGNWTLLRIGHTSTGKTNSPAPASARGLECDKLSRSAVEAHWEGMMGKIIADAGPLAGKSLKMVLADSWEARCQNWTPAMREEFKKRRGYDPQPWMPCIAGYPVGTLDESERFLWDFRRTIADLTAENHYGTFQDLCHKHNMLFTAEAPGIGMPTIADQLQCKARTDVPMGEFWFGGRNDSKEPACAAHIGGQQIASAEAFTARTPDARWTKAPFDHKALGDLNFCRGINRFVFHRYAMQPWKDRFPGMTMGPWGTNFERTNTWWEQAAPWMQYLSRCQSLLQSGRFQADLLYFYGEGAPVTLTGHEPKIPPGYDYDAIDAEALLKNLTVTDGKLTLPSGMSYRMLLLPDTDRMTPAVLRKIKELTAAGAAIIGNPPVKSPSLSGYPDCDSEVASLSKELWGENPAAAGSRVFGKGRISWGKPLQELLAGSGLKPDFEPAPTDAKCAWIHRRTDDADIYFVSSQSKEPQTLACTFRVAGKVPELWHPDTGKTEPAPLFTETDGRTTLTLKFDPAGSVFVLFRKPSAQSDPVVAFTRDGKDPNRDAALSACELSVGPEGRLIVSATKPGLYEAKTRSGKTLRTTMAKIPDPEPIEGGWQLQFPPNWGAPEHVTLEKLISWTDHPEAGVRHFSGTATYTKKFDWKGAKNQTRYFLDLGTVKEVARVEINSKDLGVLWKPPFRIEITDALKPGKNTLKVQVTNLWPNRLIGDAALPEAKRLTWASFQPYKANDPLLPSGLLGPVTVVPQAWAELH